nr:hypothetical protein CFP56_51825 [Quercus suber]
MCLDLFIGEVCVQKKTPQNNLETNFDISTPIEKMKIQVQSTKCRRRLSEAEEETSDAPVTSPPKCTNSISFTHPKINVVRSDVQSSGRFIKLINVLGYSSNGLIPSTFRLQKRWESKRGTEHKRSLKFTTPSRRD